MTVSYSADVATESFSVFFKILIRWKGTVYKILWKEFLIFICMYLTINMTYRYKLKNDPEKRRMFQTAVLACQKIADGIPLAFILAFYITTVVNRFWDRYDSLPWPDTLGFSISSFILGLDERGRLLRRTIIRYVNISFILLMRQISTPAKKRFPTLNHLVDSGVMFLVEKEAYENVKCIYPKWLIPLAWCNTLISVCKKEGRIKDEFALCKLVEEICLFHEACRRTFDYDWVCIPLIYTQVVVISLYSYFLTNLMGKQLVDIDLEKIAKGSIDSEFSWLSTVFFLFQFLFYMGWIKIAATIVNPFGEDDDDFEINYLIDRHLKIGYVLVDEMYNEHPELLKDSFWDLKEVKLPYTTASAQSEKEGPKGSAVDVKIVPEESHFLPLEKIQEENIVDLENYILGTSLVEETKQPLLKRLITKPLPIRGKERNSVTGSLMSIDSYRGGMSTRKNSLVKKLGSVLFPKSFGISGLKSKPSSNQSLNKISSVETVSLVSGKQETHRPDAATQKLMETIREGERLKVDGDKMKEIHGAPKTDSSPSQISQITSSMFLPETYTGTDDIFRFSLTDISNLANLDEVY
ncbi:unnamed protein product [Gordionus sp. m RMFG-2023]|uniref:bestrophin-4-like n=1 Tax=Gordionus sp. m RMFG-2023 TaxID=3053472 RepID=UPI0030DE0A5A